MEILICSSNNEKRAPSNDSSPGSRSPGKEQSTSLIEKPMPLVRQSITRKNDESPTALKNACIGSNFGSLSVSLVGMIMSYLYDGYAVLQSKRIARVLGALMDSGHSRRIGCGGATVFPDSHRVISSSTRKPTVLLALAGGCGRRAALRQSLPNIVKQPPRTTFIVPCSGPGGSSTGVSK